MRNGHGPIEREFSECAHKEHNLLVYPDHDAFAEVYSYNTQHAIESNNDLVVIVATYQTTDAVKRQLENHGVNVSKYIREGSLILLDSVKAYHIPDVYGVIKLAKSLQIRAAKEGKNGVTALGDMGSFFILDKTEELIDYEFSVPKIMDLKLRAFCCYHKNDFDRLTEHQQKTLTEHHNRALILA